MVGAASLYTRDVLALATGLSQWPLGRDLPLTATARSVICGSSVTVGLAVDSSGRIVRLGIQAQACAIGQASAALFAQSTIGRDADNLRAALAALRQWLKGEGILPDWPGLSVIAAARDFPARHGAITLAWEAGLLALSSASKPG